LLSNYCFHADKAISKAPKLSDLAIEEYKL